jgi:hypothetical protein
LIVRLRRLAQQFLHRPQCVFIHLGFVMAVHKDPPWLPKLAADARLKIARADAIHSYGNLEISLNLLFARLLGTKPDLAGIVLFRISNTRARSKILEQLIKRKYGAKFNLYWNFLFKFIGQLDQRRNEVVHWHMGILPNFGRTGKLTSATVRLAPPNFWDRRAGKQSLTERDLNDFALKCDFADAAVWCFVAYVMMHAGNRGLRATWRGICQQPLAYPPPDTHPIRQRWPRRIALLVPSRR